MYPLFWKIFLTYWATIVIIELVTAWFTAQLSESEIHPILEQQNSTFRENSQQAVSVLEKKGLAALRQWLENPDNLEAIDEIYVINQAGVELDNKPLPENIRKRLKSIEPPQRPDKNYNPFKSVLAVSSSAGDGNAYTVVTTFKHPHLVRYLLAPERVTFGILISGLICFFLARYFTSPLTKLRISTQMLAQGEFNTSDLQQLRSRKDEFGALAVDFEKMTNRLRELLESQKQLLRDISHELRSPLTRTRIALGLARNKNPASDSEELDRIERELERFEILIGELLTFVKIEPGNQSFEMTVTDLSELLDQVAQDARYEHQEKLRTTKMITLDCPPNVEMVGDPRLLHRAIDNIVRNACYYSPGNTSVDIRCHQDTRAIHITIEDNGPGVPENMLEKIFQPFVRVSPARESDTGGSGIGLAIAKRVIDIHNGTIAAANKLNNSGLVVSITLPLPVDVSAHSKVS
ncbi:MAG: ATP-binding protein [Gammaproteobacteria bacterium]|jgi:two-component system sensor histidine kinase CpxA